MPVIQRSAPKALPPEGPAKLLVTESTYGKSKDKHTPFFELIFKDLATGLTFKDRMYLTETSSWKVDNFCKSAGLLLPDGPYRITTDDLDGRVVYGPIVHETLQDGRKAAKMKSFWRREYALEQDPDLALIADPAGVPGPVKLSLVDAPVNTSPAEPEFPAAKAAPAETSLRREVLPGAPALTQPPAKAEKASYDDPDEPTEEEMAEAFAYAKERKALREQGK